MTIQEAINVVDKLKPNSYDYLVKVKWLSKLDGQIYREVFATHEDNPAEGFNGYDHAEPEQTLLVPYPYDADIYTYFLQAQIDKENGEINKYNQSVTLYNNAYGGFQAWYNRTHMPVTAGRRFRF